MHSLWHTVVLAFVADVRTVTAVHNLKFSIFLEALHMALLLLVTTLLDKINSLFACNVERVNVLRD